VGRSLSACAIVLTVFYALVSAGFSCTNIPPPSSIEMMVPQLFIAESTGGRLATILLVVLSVLASFTSFNGALLALSRFAYALANLGLLPPRLGRIEPRTLVAREALAALLGLAIGATLIVSAYHAHEPSILAAAVAVAFVYAGASFVRERPAFLEATRSRLSRFSGHVLTLALAGLGVGVLVDAGGARSGTLWLLAIAYGIAGIGAARIAQRKAPLTMKRPEAEAHDD
jgi:amino acid transporter